MTSEPYEGGSDVYVIAEMCVTAHYRCAVPVDLELFIVLIIPTFAEEFCRLAALGVLDFYSKALNKYRHAQVISSFCTLFVVLCLKQGSKTGSSAGSPAVVVPEPLGAE